METHGRSTEQLADDLRSRGFLWMSLQLRQVALDGGGRLRPLHTQVLSHATWSSPRALIPRSRAGETARARARNGERLTASGPSISVGPVARHGP